MASENSMKVLSNMDEITTPDANAQIHGMLSSLTNTKDQSRGTKRCFQGEIHYDSKKMRLVGFNEEQQTQLKKLSDTQSPVKISHWEIQ